MQQSRIKWQCRRGMRELDELLLGYLEHCFDTAGNTEKAAFRSLLALPDPDLVGYLLQQQSHPPELTVVIQKLLDRTDA